VDQIYTRLYAVTALSPQQRKRQENHRTKCLHTRCLHENLAPRTHHLELEARLLSWKTELSTVYKVESTENCLSIHHQEYNLWNE